MMELTDISKVFIYNEKNSARGCGHTGFVFFYKDGSGERIFQSATNPDAVAWKLILLNQPVHVEVVRYPYIKYIRQAIGKANYFEIKSADIVTIRERINEYIRKDSPYNSLTNNCAHFIHFALSKTSDVKSKKKIVPNKYYTVLKSLNHQKKKTKY